MKLSTVLLLGMMGVVGYLVYNQLSAKQPDPQPKVTQNPAGGKQLVVQQDPFQATLSAVSAVFGAVNAWAQTAPKTT